MKRRQFISRTLLAGTALVMTFPKKAMAQNIESIDEFLGTYTPENGTGFIVLVSIWVNAITDFTNTGIEKKRATLLTGMTSKDDNKLNYQAEYRVKSSKALKNQTSEYKIEFEFDKEVQHDFKLPEVFQVKKLTLQFHNESGKENLSILDKKGNVLVTLTRPKKNSEADDDDCFITTACVQFMGKTDDCRELCVLRQFRDNILNLRSDGRSLVDDYYEIAPAIVQAINASPSPGFYYDDIYQHMILPTIQCIEDQNSEKAMQIYREYTLELKRKLNS